jgi:hypothetical protein
MRVRIYDVDQNTGAETFVGEDWLGEILEHDDPEYALAEDYLRQVGTYRIGGGAAPLVMLQAVR